MTTRKKKPKVAPQVRYEYEMDKNCHRAREKQEAVLAWISGRKTYSQDGRRPTTEEFIKEAFRVNSPMYKARVLERDIKKAAQQNWYHEAQYYLRHINVVRVNIVTKEATPPIRAFVPIKYSAGGKIAQYDYQSAKRVYADATMTSTVLRDAHYDLMAWVDRYKRYSEFLEVYSELLAFIKTLPVPDSEPAESMAGV